MTAQPSIRRSTTLTRDITVLNRYEVKQDFPKKDLHTGDVVLHVRNDRGVEYYTTLRRTKRHECTCPSRKPCYHIARMVAAENARWDAAQARAARKAAAEAEWAEAVRGAQEARAYGEKLEAIKAAEMAAALAEQAAASDRVGKVFDEILQAWVTPPCEDLGDVLDPEHELGNWHAIKRQVKDRGKAQIMAQMREVKERAKSSQNIEDAPLNGASQGFRLMR
jgi:hypothetical protein